MQKSDEPAYLGVGTEISAKFKGAFCEAKVKKVTKLVRCKVVYKAAPFGTATFEHSRLRAASNANTESPQLSVGIEVLAPPLSSVNSSTPSSVNSASTTNSTNNNNNNGGAAGKASKQPQLVTATIQHVKDLSTYVVLFNDGDERTLRRSQLCLKSGKHFSVNLDAMPLTNPEQFGSPVPTNDEAGTSKKKHHKQVADSDETSSCDDDGVDSESTVSDNTVAEAAIKSTDYGRAVCVYEDDEQCRLDGQQGSSDHPALNLAGRMRPKWYPAMIVHPSAHSTVKLTPDKNTLVRSFRDAKYYSVSCHQCSAFVAWKARNCLTAVSHTTRPTLEKALAYAEHNSLPSHWNRDALLGRISDHSTNTDDDNDHQCDDSDSSTDYSAEERDVFVAQLYKYQDERDTPINRAPVLGGKDLNLFRLYRVVQKLGGYSRVCTTSTWKVVLKKMKLDGCAGANQTTIKNCYARYLLHFDSFYRQLGWRMTNETGEGKRVSRGFRPKVKMRERRLSNASSTGGKKTPTGSSHPSSTNKTPKKSSLSADNPVPGDNYVTPPTAGVTPKLSTASLATLDKSNKPSTTVEGGEKEQQNKKQSDGVSGTPSRPTSSAAVIVESFQSFKTGQQVKALYVSGAFKRWYDAKILRIEVKTSRDNDEEKQLSRVYVHYCGWKQRFDEWLPPNKIKLTTPGARQSISPASSTKSRGRRPSSCEPSTKKDAAGPASTPVKDAAVRPATTAVKAAADHPASTSVKDAASRPASTTVKEAAADHPSSTPVKATDKPDAVVNVGSINLALDTKSDRFKWVTERSADDSESIKEELDVLEEEKITGKNKHPPSTESSSLTSTPTTSKCLNANDSNTSTITSASATTTPKSAATTTTTTSKSVPSSVERPKRKSTTNIPPTRTELESGMSASCSSSSRPSSLQLPHSRRCARQSKDVDSPSSESMLMPSSERKRRMSASSTVSSTPDRSDDRRHTRHNNHIDNSKDRSRSSSRSSSRLQHSSSNTSNTNNTNDGKTTRVTRSRAAADPHLVRQWSRGNVLLLEEGVNQSQDKEDCDSPDGSTATPNATLDQELDDVDVKREVDADDKHVDGLAGGRVQALDNQMVDELHDCDDEEDDDNGITVKVRPRSQQEKQVDPVDNDKVEEGDPIADSTVNDDVKSELADEVDEEGDDGMDSPPPSSAATSPHKGHSRPRRRRRNQSHGWPERKVSRKEKDTIDTSDQHPHVTSPRHGLTELKHRLQLSMSSADMDVMLQPFNLPDIPLDVDGRCRLTAMESRLAEVRDAYQDVKNELMRLERTWKRTQQRRSKRDGDEPHSRESSTQPSGRPNKQSPTSIGGTGTSGDGNGVGNGAPASKSTSVESNTTS